MKEVFNSPTDVHAVVQSSKVAVDDDSQSCCGEIHRKVTCSQLNDSQTAAVVKSTETAAVVTCSQLNDSQTAAVVKSTETAAVVAWSELNDSQTAAVVKSTETAAVVTCSELNDSQTAAVVESAAVVTSDSQTAAVVESTQSAAVVSFDLDDSQTAAVVESTQIADVVPAPTGFVLVVEDELIAGKNPRKKLLKEIFDSLLVAEALLLLSQSGSSRGQAPDKQAHAPSISQDAVVFNTNIAFDNEEEEVVAPYYPQAGDTVRLLSDDPRFACYVVKVDKIEEENLICRWYFFPEETKEGRLQFHGETELFSSDSSTIQSVHTVIGQCTVHTLSAYNELIEASRD